MHGIGVEKFFSKSNIEPIKFSGVEISVPKEIWKVIFSFCSNTDNYKSVCRKFHTIHLEKDDLRFKFIKNISNKTFKPSAQTFTFEDEPLLCSEVYKSKVFFKNIQTDDLNQIDLTTGQTNETTIDVPDLNHMVIYQDYLITVHASRKLTLRNLSLNSALKTVDLNSHCFSVCAHNNKLYIGLRDEVEIWDISKFQVLKNIIVTGDVVKISATTDQFAVLVKTQKTGELRIYNNKTFTKLFWNAFTCSHYAIPFFLMFSDSELYSCFENNNQLEFTDLNTGKNSNIILADAPISECKIIYDQYLLIRTNNNKISIWDKSSGKNLHQLTENFTKIIDFSEESGTLTLLGEPLLIKVFNWLIPAKSMP